MAEPVLLTEISDGVASLTLNRPEKRNALSGELRAEIVAALDRLEADPAVKAVILSGAGKAFCAGFDRAEFEGSRMEEVFADAAAYHRRVYTFAKPLIAAVNGAALGGGCDLAAMCDVRLAASTAVFGQPQVRFGAGAAYELMHSVMNTGAAREMCLSGRVLDAREALSAGLISRVVEPDDLPLAARDLAGEIAALPGDMAASLKRTIVAGQPPLFT